MIWVEMGAASSPRSRHTSSSTSGSTWAKVPTAPEIFPTRTASRARRRRSRLRPASTNHRAGFSPKTVRAPDAEGVLVAESEDTEGTAEPLEPGKQQLGRRHELERLRGVDHVGRCEAEMDVPRVGPDRFLEVGEEGD